jgi:hypothetical protein
VFESLTKFLPQLEENQRYGDWVIDQESKGTLDDPIQMPFVDYGKTVTDIEQAVYGFMDEHPEFELTRYSDILKRNGLGRDGESIADADVSTLGGQGIMALLVRAIRAERFCDGALLDFFEKGLVKRWIERLQEIDNSPAH